MAMCDLKTLLKRNSFYCSKHSLPTFALVSVKIGLCSIINWGEALEGQTVCSG